MTLFMSIPALAFAFVLAWVACLLCVIWQRVFRRFGRRAPLTVKVAALVVTTAATVGGLVAWGLLLFNPNGLNSPQTVGVSTVALVTAAATASYGRRVFRDRSAAGAGQHAY
ncbi:hypothetical protein R4172_19325, partial [Rhodococcus kroppenstedtii]|uniref:hypothetical protein n=1 Tax=Rhodococcoides kroppenstedtii TaxID=293050 RepID=UPI0029542F71